MGVELEGLELGTFQSVMPNTGRNALKFLKGVVTGLGEMISSAVDNNSFQGKGANNLEATMNPDTRPLSVQGAAMITDPIIDTAAAGTEAIASGDPEKIGNFTGKVVATVALTKKLPVKGKVTAKTAPVTNSIYKRPNNATTATQRASVQNKPCVDCGNTTTPMVADHKTPLVVEHYTTGTVNRTNMRSTSAVQPQCTGCSASQGGRMSQYSKKMKKIINERKKD